MSFSHIISRAIGIKFHATMMKCLTKATGGKVYFGSCVEIDSSPSWQDRDGSQKHYSHGGRSARPWLTTLYEQEAENPGKNQGTENFSKSPPGSSS